MVASPDNVAGARTLLQGGFQLTDESDESDKGVETAQRNRKFRESETARRPDRAGHRVLPQSVDQSPTCFCKQRHRHLLPAHTNPADMTGTADIVVTTAGQPDGSVEVLARIMYSW